MRILIFGLPGSGKTTLAQELLKKIPCLYLNADRVRELFNDKDFSMHGRINQAKRMRALADMAPQQVVIADFVCPTEETRKIFDADLSIWMNTITDSRFENTNKIFEIPKNPDIVITTKDAQFHAKDIVRKITSATPEVTEVVFMVSGYMRTGTSMMMRALEEGGLTVVARESRDEYRKKFADEYYDPNEGGLYELERKDYQAPDLPRAYKGKLIKCLMAGSNAMAVVPKLKVVFMRRDFEEIRQSYQGFFDQNLQVKPEVFEKRIEACIEQLHNRKDTDVQVFWYREVVENPIKYFEILKNEGWPIDPQKAATIVNPELCRFRKENLTLGII